MNDEVLNEFDCSSDGKVIVSVSVCGRIDIDNNGKHHFFRGESMCVALSPCGNFFAIGLNSFDIIIWDINSLKIKHTLRGHSATINSMCYFSDGKKIASAADDGCVRVFNIEETEWPEIICKNYADNINVVRVVPPNNSIISADGSGTIHFLEQNTSIYCHGSSICAMDVSFDGKFLLTGDMNSCLKQWNIETNQLLQMHYETQVWNDSHNTGNGVPITHIQFMPKSIYFAVSYQNGKIFIAQCNCVYFRQIRTIVEQQRVMTVKFISIRSTIMYACGAQVKRKSLLENFAKFGYHLLKANIAFYLVLDILNFLACRKLVTFQVESDFLHFEKFSMLTKLKKFIST